MAEPGAVVRALGRAGLTLATGASLTAGLVAATLADVPGCSSVLRGGVVAYQGDVKADVLGVPDSALACGLVSREVAEAIDGVFLECDVSDPAASDELVAKAVSEFGGLDIAFLNAGIATGCGLVENFDLEKYRRAMGVNLDGVVFGINSAVRSPPDGVIRVSSTPWTTSVGTLSWASLSLLRYQLARPQYKASAAWIWQPLTPR